MSVKQKKTALNQQAKRIESLLKRMTIREKIRLVSGADFFHTAAVERLGIRSVGMTDGPHAAKALGKEATAFPAGIALAATWNPDLVAEVGRALGDETRAAKCEVLLGPCVNIVRTPLAGRNFESYSEDPFLAGRIGVGWVNGIQSRGISACLKHFACNNQEFERMRGNSVVDERALRELYLPQFETILKEARPWSVMCAYNRVNGTYASENGRLLNDILRREWGFPGIVVSDWGAKHTIVESLKAGLDLEMPGPGKYGGSLLSDAFNLWQIEENTIDEAVRRVLLWADQCGRIGPRPAARGGKPNLPANRRLARCVAEEAMVLLKNDGNALPLVLRGVKSIAVIGPTAARFPVSGLGSSYHAPSVRVEPLDELKRKLGSTVRIDYVQGCENVINPPMMTGATLEPGKKSGTGLKAEFFNNPTCSGKPVVTRVDANCDFWLDNKAPAEGVEAKRFSVRWTGTVRVAETARYLFRTHALGEVRLFIDGKRVLKHRTAQADRREPACAHSRKDGYVVLTAGKEHKLRLEYAKFAGEDVAFHTMNFGKDPIAGAKAGIAEAVALAKSADLALLFVGHPEGWEGEGYDRPHMRMTGRQDELVRQVARANPRTIVVWSGGAPTAMPWIREVSAVLAALYPGQEGAAAVVRLLLGEVNPSGKLPVTFPRRYEDNPTYGAYPGGRDVVYKEGIFVGYRYYDQKGIEPLFPFGFGLSYTTFEYSGLKTPSRVRIGQSIPVSVTVANTGVRAGQETVQLYVEDEKASLPRPPKELKGFVKIALAPGESRRVRFTVSERDLSFYDPARKQWVAEPGTFRILVGTSSRDIRQEHVVEMTR